MFLNIGLQFYKLNQLAMLEVSIKINIMVEHNENEIDYGRFNFL